jgi:hypothetical protein
MCKISRRADYDGRGGVAGQYKGEHPIICSAAGVGTRMNLFSRDDVGRVQVLLKPGGQQNLQQVLWKSRK